MQESNSVKLLAQVRSVDKTTSDVLVSVNPPSSGASRSPVDICCVVDVSGSMGTEATIKNSSGNTESHGLSILDIVKHAVRTIVSALNEHDRLALVVYHTAARIIFNLTAMTEDAKKKIEKDIEDLHPEDMTNLWDGLLKALDLIGKDSQLGKVSTVLILTDGLPNVTPPGGELKALKDYKEKTKISTNISTFGFGYSLDSKLLREIAIEGNGLYTFIPDSSFVGTAFVNSLTNLLTTMGQAATLSLEPADGIKILNFFGGHVKQDATWGSIVNLCTLQYGQTKDIVIRVSHPEDYANKELLTATLSYEPRGDRKAVKVSVDVKNDGNATAAEVEVQRLRLQFVDTVRSGLDSKIDVAVKEIEKLAAEIQNSSVNSDARIKALSSDVTGQVREAFSKEEFFNKWGKHYLPSLVRAHQLQQCTNFKDPGVQVYGGELFNEIRDEIDEVFCKLPPPKASVRKYSSTASTAPAITSMSSYYNSSAPCFHGESKVMMMNEETKWVREIMKGDVVVSSGNQPAVVECVVKTLIRDGKRQLVELPGGLLVTEYHPIRKIASSSWQFPINVSEGKLVEKDCSAIYSFVLSGTGSSMMINGYECVSLGHQLQGDAVVEHPYFGSFRVKEDLKKAAGFGSGLVQFREGCVVRNPETSLVDHFDLSYEI